MSVQTSDKPIELLPYPTGPLRELLKLPQLVFRLGLGNILHFTHIMILTTRGRKTGLPRHAAIEYRRHGSKYYVVSAWGTRPHWFQNLLADPLVTVQQGARTFAAQATVVRDQGEALRVLHLFRRTSPQYYEQLAVRVSGDSRAHDVTRLPEITDQFTIVRLDKVGGALALPPLRADLKWVLPVALTVGLVTLAIIGFAPSQRRS